jgi:hypothetical protein
VRGCVVGGERRWGELWGIHGCGVERCDSERTNGIVREMA